MAGEGFAIDAPSNGFDGEITLSVVITCIVAASSGLLFGYDVGISGFFFLLICVSIKIFLGHGFGNVIG
jgi:hypothetical protein